MRFYKLSQARVKRVIKSPLRVEEGIAPDTVAVMQPASYKGVGKERTWNQEIWVMYALKKGSSKIPVRTTDAVQPGGQSTKIQKDKKFTAHNLLPNANSITIISAWRYPGKTNPREALPEEIMQEVREATNSYR